MDDSDNRIVDRENWPEPARSVLAKLERANEHIESMKAEINAWVATEPHHFASTAQADGAKHFVATVFDPLPDVDRWGLMVGDILHNLRSGLDHLAWKLVEVSGGTPDNRTEFPIFKDKAAWESASRRKKVKGMRRAIVAEIDSMQPYHREDGAHRTRLWILQNLNNRDKHRLITPVVLSPSTGDYRITPSARVTLCRETLAHGTVFMEIEPDQPTQHVRVQLSLAAHVAVDVTEGVRLEAGQLMADLRDEATKAAGRLTRLFM